MSALFSLEASTWDNSAAWAPYDETCHLNNEIKRTTVRAAFGIDSCLRGALSITEGHELEQTNRSDIEFDEGWAQLGFKVENGSFEG